MGVDEDERGCPPGVTKRKREGEKTAEAVADESDRLRSDRRKEERVDVVDHSGKGVAGGRSFAPAGTAKVVEEDVAKRCDGVRDREEPAGEVVHDEPVKEDDGRTRFVAEALAMEAKAVDEE